MAGLTAGKIIGWIALVAVILAFLGLIGIDLGFGLGQVGVWAIWIAAALFAWEKVSGKELIK